MAKRQHQNHSLDSNLMCYATGDKSMSLRNKIIEQVHKIIVELAKIIRPSFSRLGEDARVSSVAIEALLDKFLPWLERLDNLADANEAGLRKDLRDLIDYVYLDRARKFQRRNKVVLPNSAHLCKDKAVETEIELGIDDLMDAIRLRLLHKNPRLSESKKRVLELLASGMDSHQIAAETGLKLETVREYEADLYYLTSDALKDPSEKLKDPSEKPDGRRKRVPPRL